MSKPSYGRVGLRDKLSLMPPRKLKLLGVAFFAAAGAMLAFGAALTWLGLKPPHPALAISAPFLIMGLAAVGLWLVLLSSARSSYERRMLRYISREELEKVEREVEAELPSDLEDRELVRRVEVKRRIEALYNAKVEAEFLEKLKRRLRFKAGEVVLSMASRQWSGSTFFLFLLPLILLGTIILSGAMGWMVLILLFLAAIYFSSSNYSVLYVATNRRLIKRVYSSSLFRRSESGEEIRWSAVKDLKVTRGRRGVKVRLKGEDEVVDVDRLKGEDAEKLIKVIEEQVALAKKAP